MGWWLGFAVQRSDRSSRRRNHVRVSPSLGQPRVPVNVFGVEVVGHQDRQSPAETSGQVRLDQWARRSEVSCKDFLRFAGQRDLNSSGLHVGQARYGH